MAQLNVGIGRWIRAALTENVGLKLVALVASVSLFSLVHGTEDAQRSLFVDVVALLPPPDSDRILVSELPERVKLTLRGSRSVLNSIRREDIETVQIDLRDARRRYYYLEPTAFELPAGISVVQIAPSAIQLQWEERIRRELEVEVPIVGQPPDGLVVRRPLLVEPATVQADGPRSELRRIRTALTESLDVSGLASGVHVRRLPLLRASPHMQFSGVQSVEVTAEVVAELSDRIFPNLPVVVEGAAPVGVRPSTVRVTVQGARSRVERLDPKSVVPTVDATNFARVRPELREVIVRGLRADIRVVQVDPPEVLLVPRKRSTADGDNH